MIQNYIYTYNEHLHFITKDKSKATSFVHIDKEAEAGVKIIKELTLR